MKKLLSILMLFFLVGFAIQSCTNDDTEEFNQTKEGASAIGPPEVKVPPGG